jgi:predicted lipoprotein with Yx(FWY)xxD motif
VDVAERTGREGKLNTAQMVGGTLAAVVLSVGALSASTFASSPASAVSSSGKSLAITTQKVPKVGTVLATKSGQTLYRFTVDPAGKATCTGTCAKVWPPLLLPKGVSHLKVPRGVKGLSVVHVTGGRLQVFFHHQALYTFVNDTKKGQAGGQGVENDWFVVLSSGKSSAPASVSTPSSPPSVTTQTPTTTPAAAGTPTQTPTTTTPTTSAATSATPPMTQPTSPPTTTPHPVTTTTQPPATTTTVPSGGGGTAF